MSTSIKSFALLPESLRGLAIELAIIRARQDQHRDLRTIVEEAITAAVAANSLDLTIHPHVAVDPAKPGTEETAYQEVAASPDSDYVDPEIFDPASGKDDTLDALTYLFGNLTAMGKPEKHCGRADCKACNHSFGKRKEKQENPKARFRLFAVKDGGFGPVSIYRNESNLDVYALVHRGKTTLVEISDVGLISYQAAVEIIRIHGKEDCSTIG